MDVRLHQGGENGRSQGVAQVSDTELIETLRAEIQRLTERTAVQDAALVTIERRLREDTGPQVKLVNEHGGLEERKAWKSVYSSAICAQVVGPKALSGF